LGEKNNGHVNLIYTWNDPGPSLPVKLDLIPDSVNNISRASPIPFAPHSLVGEVSFSSPELTVMENDGHAVVNVVRTVAVGSMSIDFATYDETASAGDDYQETKGTLRFKKGETKKQIRIPIIDDEGCEPGKF
jgi:hypothetical protein